MSDQIPNLPQQSSDEIDLGQLFKMIGDGVRSLFKSFLRVFVYLKRNAIVLAVLGVVGVVLGYGLKTVISEKLKTDVIVVPIMEGKRYLFNIVEEINANIEAEDPEFFESLGISVKDVKDFEVSVESMKSFTSESGEMETKYLEVLQTFQNTDATTDIIRKLLLDQNTEEHKITFTYKDPIQGPEVARKLMSYILNNEYLGTLINTYNENAKTRITQNDSIIKQLDRIIEGYTEQMRISRTATEGRMILEEEDQLDIPQLFSLKNQLIMQSESKRLELVKQGEAIKILYFGNSHPVKVPVFGEFAVFMPLILIGAYLVFGFIKYLNRKSNDLLIKT